MKMIDLSQHRPGNSTSYSGRPQGESLRVKLGLDSLDNGNDHVLIKIPRGTTSFNPSFFLGLLYNSIKKLGVQGFNEKYSLEIEDEDSEFIESISEDLADGMRNAINSLNKVSARNFLKKRIQQ